MITRLGATNAITPNSNIWDLLAHPIDAITYSVTGIQDTIEGIGQPDIKGSLPNPIVASQGAPSTVYQGSVAGAWTPEDAAATGLANEQIANSAMLTDYTNSLNGGIPWGTIAVIGACVIGFVVIVPMLGKGR